MTRSEKKRPLFYAFIKNTPLGSLGTASSDQGLVAVEFVDSRDELFQILQRRFIRDANEVLSYLDHRIEQNSAAAACAQLDEYLRGRRQEFETTIDWSVMTPFQEAALKLTCNIPYGQVATYAHIARQIGKPNAARAVGRAEATNPMPLVIPCHRVIGTDGGLHGYGGRGGLQTKAWLLRLEGALSR